MGVDIQIEGVSVIGGQNASGRWWTDISSVSVDQDIAVQQTTANFDLWIQGTYDAAANQYAWPIPAPRGEQEVIFLDQDGLRAFGGILQNPTETEESGPTMFRYQLQCTTFQQWFNRHLVNQTYAANTTVQDLVNSVVAQYVNTPGNGRLFTTHHVQANPPLPMPILQFVYQTPAEVMSQITQMLGWGWYIDYYRDVHLYSTTYAPSPLPAGVLDADQFVTNPGGIAADQYGNWMALSISEDASQLKNRVYITGIYVAQTQLYTESLVADGQQTVFNLSYQPPNDVANITVNVGGTQYQIALDLVAGTPGGPCQNQTAYVNFSNQTVRVCTAPASGTVVTVTYFPMTQTVVGEQDAASQAVLAARTGTDGIFEFNNMDPSLSAELPTLAQERAQITLAKYAFPIVTLTFTSFLAGWQVGQYFVFRSQRRYQGVYDGKNFFVIRVSKKLVRAAPGAPWLWRYQVVACDIPFEI